jgi:uncharacterized membrane protein YhiD involved in acid resistance
MIILTAPSTGRCLCMNGGKCRCGKRMCALVFGYSSLLWRGLFCFPLRIRSHTPYTVAMTSIAFSDIYVQLFLAMALGMILGVERFVAHKTAGMRTYTLVSMGSALFVIISRLVVAQFASVQTFDPLRIAAQVVAAAGFLGVGAIFRTEQGVAGVTTASGLWVAAGIGMACGFGLYQLAVLVAGLGLFTFIVLWFIEKQIRKIPIGEKEQKPL